MLKGYMDNLLFSVHDGWAVSGWAADFDQIGKALRIEILHEGQILVTGSANKYRQDLFDEGIGDGLHGFLFPLSFDLLKQAESLELSMRLAGQDIAIGDAVVFQVKPAVGWLNKLEFALAPAIFAKREWTN